MNDFNLVFGQLVVPFIKLCLIVAFVVSFVTVVRLHKYLDVVSLVMISTMVWTTILDLFPTAIIMSKLYDVSQKFSWNVSERCRPIALQTDRLFLKMQIESCQLIRCQVGGLYYMEAKAKLTLIHQMVNGVVYLLVNVKV